MKKLTIKTNNKKKIAFHLSFEISKDGRRSNNISAFIRVFRNDFSKKDDIYLLTCNGIFVEAKQKFDWIHGLNLFEKNNMIDNIKIFKFNKNENIIRFGRINTI